MSKTVAVLMGGRSAEREVSMTSGKACAAALREAGYTVKEVIVGHDIAALIQDLTPKPDVVFNALHGRWGEDGCIQGLLELLDLTYTHSGVMASALAIDKQVSKHIVATAGITSPEGRIVTPEELEQGDPMPRPYVVKPVNEGSSVGVHIVQPGDNTPVFDDELKRLGDRLLIEKFIAGRELTVSVMGDQPLAVTEIIPKIGFYDYRAKYTDGKADHVVPADIPASVTKDAMDAALAAHQALGCRGVSRSDFRYDDTEKDPGDLYYLETNTQPGMTALSLVPEQAKYLGMSFPDLCAWMVEHATCDS
ncbi:MAG: D-alanine--D-alanine ligase [Pseudomonadota bacterium]